MPAHATLDSFELARYEDEEREFPDEPDEPLPLLDPSNNNNNNVNAINRKSPRWLYSTPSWTIRLFQRAQGNMETLRPRWLEGHQSSLWQRCLQLLRPRFTIGYIIFSIIALYVLYCYLFWSPLFASRLPSYTGPYQRVGAIDVEVAVQEPRQIGNMTFQKDSRPAFQLDTVLFTLYYPAAKGVKSTQPRHKWFPKPISLIARGYAIAAHFDNFLARPLFTFALWGLASSITIPADVDVPFISSSVDEDNLSHLPIVVLSHGDVSSRSDYTAYCGELASRGIVVAAIEHRDGSCPGSIVHLPDNQKKNILLFRADHLQPEGPKAGVSNDDWRFQKLAFRDAEIEETISVLRQLNAGEGRDVFENNYRKEGQNLPAFKNRLDFSYLIIAGHSFGATGAMQALKSANKTKSTRNWDNPAVGGIILDPGKSSGQLNPDIDVPLLILHSQSWSKAHTVFFGRPHFDTVRDIAQEVLQRTGAAWFMTSLKTSHPSVTDAPLIEPLLLSWTTGATINVKEGLREYVKASVDFIDYLRYGKRKDMLDVGVTHEEYGNDTRTDLQKERMDPQIFRYWEVHVAPPASFSSDD